MELEQTSNNNNSKNNNDDDDDDNNNNDNDDDDDNDYEHGHDEYNDKTKFCPQYTFCIIIKLIKKTSGWQPR